MIEKLKQVDDRWEDEKGISYASRLEYLETAVCGFCGCGDPDSVLKYVRNHLKDLVNHNFRPYSDLAYMFFVYWANDKDFAEHGTTARCSWLTPKGLELLRDIEELLPA